MADTTLEEVIKLTNDNPSSGLIEPAVAFSKIILFYRKGDIDKNACLELCTKAINTWPELRDSPLVTALLADMGLSFSQLQSLQFSKMQLLYYLLTFSDFQAFQDHFQDFKDMDFFNDILKDNVIIHGVHVFQEDSTLFNHLLLNAYSIFEKGHDASKKLAYLFQNKLIKLTSVEEAIEITKRAIHNADPKVVAVLLDPKYNPYWQQCTQYHVQKSTRQQYDCEIFKSPNNNNSHNFSAGYSLLHIAALSDNVDLFQRAFDEWAKTRPGKEPIMKEFLDWAREPGNISDHPYETILNTAARGGASKIFKFLIEKGLSEYRDILGKMTDRDQKTVTDYLITHALNSTSKITQYNSKENYLDCLRLLNPELNDEALSKLVDEYPHDKKVGFLIQSEARQYPYVSDHGLRSIVSTMEEDSEDYEDEYKESSDNLNTTPTNYDPLADQSVKNDLLNRLIWLSDIQYNRSINVESVLEPIMHLASSVKLTQPEIKMVSDDIQAILCNFITSDLSRSNSRGIEQLINLSKQLKLDLNSILLTPHAFFEGSVIALNKDRKEPFSILNNIFSVSTDRQMSAHQKLSSFSHNNSDVFKAALFDRLNWLKDNNLNRSAYIVDVLQPIMSRVNSINLTQSEQNNVEESIRLLLCNYMDSFLESSDTEGLELLLDLSQKLKLDIKTILETTEPKFEDTVMSMNVKREEDHFDFLTHYLTDLNNSNPN
ncbi:hypothetical protein [Legionella spiritensis]|uniref:Uncharacterized protein n=1 Tax=Legionella spiritensis TaxID=452 RepID=A0A0W0YWE2_LEGSP|nr:hypothetical protein [Legionella spiritensis]KTD61191.1 hypothetical protein Lspi_2811 [Legionella spiritensis]SNV28398.1 Uncharacterised protein [Legionella spiritensis]